MEVFACIVGRSKRPYHYMFLLADRRDTIELAYPLWVLRTGNGTILVDTGFSPEIAAERGVFDYRSPSALLTRLEVDPKDISTIVISHLHFDHFSVPERFPNARFFVQSDDLDYFTGRGLRHPAGRASDPAAMAQLGALRAAGRLEELSGDLALTPEVKLVHVGGHTPGHQITALAGAEGVPLVLACDAAHFYENVRTRTPTSLIHDYDDYQRGFEVIETLAANGRWFPGHDPSMLDRLEKIDEAVYRVPQ